MPDITPNGVNGSSPHLSNDYNSAEGAATYDHASNPHTPPPPPIAIVGMGMRLPGGIRTDDDLWEHLINMKDARQPIPEDRYKNFHSDHGKQGTIPMTHGYFLDLDLSHMDAGFFSMSKAEVERLDPQQRLLLEVVYEAFESSGETGWRGKDVGCYVGSFGEDWLDLHAKDTLDFGMYRITGSGDFLLANRLSYEYNLRGPSMTIKVGCSSSMVGLHLACEALYKGDCSSAIVAGANMLLTPVMTIAMSEQGALSPGASCQAFDANADGYARAEGVNAIYIKRLDDAIRDGNPIRAIIRSTSSNCDGKTQGIANPSSEAHASLMRQAYSVAGLDPTETAMCECHGTGTPVGDPLEVNAVAKVWGERGGVLIGSVKPNVGHSEGASGLTSVIKSVLSLENKTIVPNIKFNTPNPKIHWKEGGLQVPTTPTSWPEGRQERISVNSFGIGGANAHVVIDSAASYLPLYNKQKALQNGVNGVNGTNGIHGTNLVNGTRRTIVTHELNGFSGTNGINGTNGIHKVHKPTKIEGESISKSSLLTFSANHTDALKKSIHNIKEYYDERKPLVEDLAYTLGARRDHLSYRAFAIVDESGSFEVPPTTSKKTSTDQPPVFIFTGQGAQWAEMGKELMTDFPSFLETLRFMDRVLDEKDPSKSWSIEDELLKPESESRLHIAELAQPICTALQIGLVDLLDKWGIRPAAVIGHSSGEIAAAYAAGCLTVEEAIHVAYCRGLVTKQQKRRGGIAAIGLGRDEVLPFLVSSLTIACENSGSSVTISGDEDALESFLEDVKKAKPDVLARRLRVDMAYHSDHMRDVGGQYQSMMEGHIFPQDAQVPFYSTVTAKVQTKAAQFGPSYWRANLESPVLFYSGINAILRGDTVKDNVHLEIGPHSALAGPLRQVYKEFGISKAYVSTLARKQNASETILGAVGQLFTIGVSVDFASMYPRGHTLTDLPHYPWRRGISYWNESRVMKAWRLRDFPHHDVLGSRIAEASDLEPAWRNVFRLDNLPWVHDHLVHTDIVYPGAGYVAIAGAAVSQLSDGPGDYTVRDVTISKPLLMQPSKSTEVVTTLRPSKLTATLDSAWYEFTIVSYSSAGWIKHCNGLVRSGPASKYIAPTAGVPSLPRKVDSSRWYKGMKKVGMNYGPAFLGLRDISAGVIKTEAAATVTDSPEDWESPYQFHPVTLDLFFQLLSVAVHKGQTRLFDKLRLPTHIEELYIGPATGKDMRMYVNADVTPRDMVSASGHAVDTSGAVTVWLKDLGVSPLESDDADRDTNPHAAVHLAWRPDSDMFDAGSLMKRSGDIKSAHTLVERLSVLCIIENVLQLDGKTAIQPHLQKYHQWLRDRFQRAKDGQSTLVPDAAELVALSSSQRRSLIEETHRAAIAMENASGATVGQVIHNVYSSLLAIFDGEADALENLFKDDALTGFYNFADLWDYQELLQNLSHSNPSLRILEIGAGTGSITSCILRHLKTEFGERLYSKYCYTDISTGFFASAMERFKDYAEIEYKRLDITQDPVEQGFDEGSFDLVIVANVLHATPNLTDTLQNIRKLLHHRGRLLLQELCSETKFANYVYGTLPGWWLGGQDGRLAEPYISPERWEKELRVAGFAGIEHVQLDQEEPYQLNANILARPMTHTIAESHSKQITLLTQDEADLGPRGREFETYLKNNGFDVSRCTLQQAPPADRDVISVLELEAPLFKAVDEKTLRTFISFMSAFGSARLLWLTRSVQIDPEDPGYAITTGLTRTIRSELNTALGVLELDQLGERAWGAAVQVLERLQGEKRLSEDMEPDYEFALSRGLVHVSRFTGVSVGDELAKTSVVDAPRRLEIGKRGLLQTLRWAELPWDPMEPHEVEVDVRAVGLNFKDVLISMGIVEGRAVEGNSLGCECAGVVRRIGPEVQNVQVGDRVMVFSGKTLCSRLKTSSFGCIKMPSDLSFEEAATMPCVYVTALRSLLDIGRLQKGQTVLIHSAAGGVGIAAMHICKSIGAEIFATVGTQDKVAFLKETFGLAASHIFNSRDDSFLADVLAATGGKGVDLVLNSLSGELLHASWKCVAPFGSMIEIGKRDLIGHGKLALDLFEGNRGYFGVDVSQLSAERSVDTRRLLETLIDMYKAGQIKPITPITTFDAEAVEEAFRFLQKGTHIGKVVLRMPDDPQTLTSVPVALPASFRPDASYLLVGGLGGLGQAVSTWMVERGAKNLIFLSRSAENADIHGTFFYELRAMGCSVQAFSGSVANANDVKRVVDGADKPIAGAIQMSMILRDQPFESMSMDDWIAVHDPKVQGTWNMHNELGKDLDFFLIFSSFSGLLGQRGQANYAAANTFLDAFCQYRLRLGLPASVLDIGCMEDVGYISHHPSVLEIFKNASVHMLQERDLLESMEMLLSLSSKDAHVANKSRTGFQNAHQLAIGLRSTLPLSDLENRNIWRRDRRFAVLRNNDRVSTVVASSDNEGIRQFLSAVASDPAKLDAAASAEFLAREIGIRVCRFLMQPEEDLNVSLTMGAAGVDSLIAIEIRNWWRQNLGTEITVLEMLNGGTIAKLGGLAARRLKEKYGSAGKSQEPGEASKISATETTTISTQIASNTGSAITPNFATISYEKPAKCDTDEFATVHKACELDGFFYLDLNGQNGELNGVARDVPSAFKIVGDFFALEHEEKIKHDIDQIGLWKLNGHTPFGRNAGLAGDGTKYGMVGYTFPRDNVCNAVQGEDEFRLPQVLQKESAFLASFMKQLHGIGLDILAALDQTASTGKRIHLGK